VLTTPNTHYRGEDRTTFVPAFSLLWFAVSRKFVLRVSPPAAPRAHADFLNETG
jgi:hypothetical protein